MVRSLLTNRGSRESPFIVDRRVSEANADESFSYLSGYGSGEKCRRVVYSRSLSGVQLSFSVGAQEVLAVSILAQQHLAGKLIGRSVLI